MTHHTWRCARCRMPARWPQKLCSSCHADAEPSLFSLSDTNVRADDPSTSTAAAASVDLNAREQEVVDALRFLVVASSTHDIQQHLEKYGIKRDRNCISRRLTSLVRRGVVVDQGEKDGPHGRRVTAYRLRSAA
jgi:hypothetical protein